MKHIFFPFLMDEANPAGGAGGGGTPNPTPDPNKPAPTEAEKERDRVVAENVELRRKQREIDATAKTNAERVAALEKAGNKTSGDWKAVAETAEKEANDWKAKFETANTAFVNTLTSSKVREEALKQGLKPDLVDLLDTMDLPDVEAEIDANNRFNVKGVETAIKNLKVLKPSLFSEKQPPQFNPGGASGGAGGGAVTDVKTAQANYLAAHKNRMKDPQAFNKAHSDYQNALIAARKGK